MGLQELNAFLQHKFVQAVLVLLVAFAVFRFAIRPPIPSSLLWLYMILLLGVVFLYVSFSEESWEKFKMPVVSLLLAQRGAMAKGRRALLVVIPIVVGYLTFAQIGGGVRAPAELRAIHPAPPSTIQFKGKPMEIQGLDNPFWKGPPGMPDPALVQEGSDIYVARCVFCHGDTLKGDGIFASGLNPSPANFTDPGTIAQLQQSYLFWRIAKGGIGLPSEATPWNSAMPAWEDKLTEEQIWKVIIYLYEAAGPAINPRTWE